MQTIYLTEIQSHNKCISTNRIFKCSHIQCLNGRTKQPTTLDFYSILLRCIMHRHQAATNTAKKKKMQPKTADWSFELSALVSSTCLNSAHSPPPPIHHRFSVYPRVRRCQALPRWCRPEPPHQASKPLIGKHAGVVEDSSMVIHIYADNNAVHRD